MLLEKLVAAGIGNRPVIFVTHRFLCCWNCLHYMHFCIIIVIGFHNSEASLDCTSDSVLHRIIY